MLEYDITFHGDKTSRMEANIFVGGVDFYALGEIVDKKVYVREDTDEEFFAFLMSYKDYIEDYSKKETSVTAFEALKNGVEIPF